MFALLKPGDTILGLDLAHGGHLTHGMKINFSGKLYNVVAYHVDDETGQVDMAEVERLAKEHRPKLIIAGWSAYPRQLDFAAFRRIADEVGAYLMVDMAHFAGLVAAGLHPSPVPHAHVVTTTTHKTLGGPRGGVILSNAELAKKINSAVFPGQQGGPLEHVIAAKAVAFKVAATEEFKERQQRTLEGAKILAERLVQDDVAEAGVSVLSGGTDVHLVLVDLRNSELDGQQAEDRLHEVGITVNRNAIPNDPRPPMVTSGLRIGTPGAGHPRFPGRGLHRGRRHHRRGAEGPTPSRTPSEALRRPGHRAGGEAPAVPRSEVVTYGGLVRLTTRGTAHSRPCARCPALFFAYASAPAPGTSTPDRRTPGRQRAYRPLGVPRGHLGLRPVLDRHRPVQLPHGRPDAGGPHVRRAA